MNGNQETFAQNPKHVLSGSSSTNKMAVETNWFMSCLLCSLCVISDSGGCLHAKHILTVFVRDVI